MTITAHSLENYQVVLSNGHHTILADEPADLGGDNFGPNPYDYMLAGLAACKIITVQMYAQRKEWPLERMDIKLSHNQVKGSECDDCVTEVSKRVDIIDAEMSFHGDLTEEQIARLAEISGRCPVHRSLESETKIRSTVV